MAPQRPDPFVRRWQLHGLTVAGQTNAAEVQKRWWASFASRPVSHAEPDLVCTLDLVPAVPPPPEGAPDFRESGLIEYTVRGEHVIAHFPRFGQLRLDLAAGVTQGQVTTAALDTYGVLEDLIAIALSPHLRRRGLFLAHAFAAAPPGSDHALLLVGGIGAGKTTTGLALLDAGWQLLSNDSPILRAPAEVLSYPGLLAAYPDSFARFAATRPLVDDQPSAAGRPKLTVAAESVWPAVWRAQARCGALVFPQIEDRREHALEPLSAPEALRQLLPHAAEQWDKSMLPAHLALLSGFVRAAPAYRLRLGPEVAQLPAILAAVLPSQ